MPEVVIVPTGVANIASVQAAFRRVGAEPVLSLDADKVRSADRVMLPGVGAFGPAMEALVARGLDEALRERVRADRPTIAICVGHQVLFETSDESPGVRGLGVVEGHVARFVGDVRVPQFGWNDLHPGEGCLLLEEGYAYFANSFRAETATGCRVATAGHGGRYVAALERGALLGCQFHPELSGAYGQALLSRWLG